MVSQASPQVSHQVTHQASHQVSRHGLQQLIGTGLLDHDVLSALLSDPLSLADRFALTMPERRFLAQVQVQDLEEFAAFAEGWITHQRVVQHQSLVDRTNAGKLAG